MAFDEIKQYEIKKLKDDKYRVSFLIPKINKKLDIVMTKRSWLFFAKEVRQKIRETQL